MQLNVLISDMTSNQSLPDIEVAGITSDSRHVQQGFAFVALKGNKTDGAQYAQDAIKRGAKVIISDQQFVLTQNNVPIIHVENARHALAMMAARFYEKQPACVV